MKSCNKIIFLLPFLLSAIHAHAQTASFNFTAAAQLVTGWTNVAGDPSTGTRTATHAGITVTSTSNWIPYITGVCAANGFGKAPGVYFPAQVMSNSWSSYNGSSNNLSLYNSLAPQLLLSGLNKDSTYILRMSGSNAFLSALTQYTLAGAVVYNSQDLDAFNNTTQGVTFTQIQPDSNGVIKVFINATPSSVISTICGLQVFPGTASITIPSVAITTPLNGTILPENDNVIIHSTASESGGTVAKVEFFADTIKIGEVDTVPYNFTWVDPNPGNYTITVKATDNVGTINTATANIAIELLNDFWSTTGNSGTKADSNFIGNVDSVRLDFRTKNLQRMSISATGNVGIGITAPAAQLHTTGSVRLAGLKNDSTSADPRILVSDTSGNLSYRTGAGALGVNISDGLGQSTSGAIAIGDSIPGAGPHGFMSNRYQYLNGYLYSIGGTVNDPVKMPNFRIYNNGDITASTTMDASVNTSRQTGLRYFQKRGVMEIGASDRLDTTERKIVYGIWPGSGILLNSGAPNLIKGKLMNGIYAMSSTIIDSSTTIDSIVFLENNLVAADSVHFVNTMFEVNEIILAGRNMAISVQMNNSIVIGERHSFPFTSTTTSSISGFANIETDTSRGCLIGGANNQYESLFQFVAGNNLVNRSPSGATLGNSNVNFVTFPSTHLRGAPDSSGYPLFMLGNGAANDSSIRSDAFTTLYNGRTQINTTGFTNPLSQTAATPKAALEVVSTNSGVLLPKLTTTQRNAIISGDLQNSLLLYNNDSAAFQFYNGSTWKSLVGGSGPGGGWGATGNTNINPGSNFIGTTDTQRLVIRTNNIERMTMLGNGAVGIGTSGLPASDAKLAVNGNIYTTMIRVTQSGWPDYVFDKKYRLPNLASVEQFIKEHKHLPGMVSAVAVEQDGLDLGENQAVLLKKIEELMLYMIETHKKAADRQNEINELDQLTKKVAGRQKELDQIKETLQKLAAGK